MICLLYTSTDADKKALHDKAPGALRRAEFVGDKGTKRLHADVDTAIKDPQKGSSKI